MKKTIVYCIDRWTTCLLTIDRLKTIDCFVDDEAPEDKVKEFLRHNHFRISSIEELKKEKSGNVTIIVGNNRRYESVKAILTELGFLENIDFFNGWKLNKNFYCKEYVSDSWIEYEKEKKIDFASNSNWEYRTQKMSELIPESVKTVMDIGCGNGRLRKYLSDDVIYYGLDYTPRNENTLICDLNNEPLPDIVVDAYFLAGVIYYINNIYDLFVQMKRGKYIIFDFYDECNYMRLDGQYTDVKTPALSKRKNYLTFVELLNALAAAGFLVERGECNLDKSYVYYFRARRVNCYEN